MERKTIFFNAKVKPVKPVNEEFTLCKVYVCALDKNRNFSYIGKEAADDALATLYNCPVIGHLYIDEQGNYRMGGHDMVIVQDKDGSYRFKSLCVPYGVIPQQDEIHYEEIEEPDGRGKKTYVVANCILWTGRYPELNEAIYSEECWFGQSMEIGILEHEPLKEDKNYTNILKYTYSALCLLGKSDNPDYHVEPCFPESRIEPYEFALQNAQFTELMTQLKNELTSCFANIEKGGEGMNENEIIITEQTETTKNFEETAEIIDTVVEVAEGAETNIKMTERTSEKATENAENFKETHTDTVEQQAKTFSSTYKEKRDAIDNALPRLYETDENGNIMHDVYYWLCDFDDTHVFVEKSEYIKNSGYTEVKGRFAYSFDDENKTVSIEGEMEEMFVKWLTKEELDQIEAQRVQYEELTEYKAARVKADHEAEIDAAIREFTDLEGNEEFATIVADKYSYETVEALRNACYIIRGKFSAPVNQYVKSTGNTSVPVGTHIEPDVYEGFFARYGKKKTVNNGK